MPFTLSMLVATVRGPEDFSFGKVAVLSDDSIAAALDFVRSVDGRRTRYLRDEGWMTLVTYFECVAHA